MYRYLEGKMHCSAVTHLPRATANCDATPTPQQASFVYIFFGVRTGPPRLSLAWFTVLSRFFWMQFPAEFNPISSRTRRRRRPCLWPGRSEVTEEKFFYWIGEYFSCWYLGSGGIACVIKLICATVRLFIKAERCTVQSSFVILIGRYVPWLIMRKKIARGRCSVEV